MHGVILLATLVLSLPFSARAQSYSAVLEFNPAFRVSFLCTGAPVCTGTYQTSFRRAGCSNTFVLIDAITMSGFTAINSYIAEPSQGTIKLSNLDFTLTTNSDGSCSFNTMRDLQGSYVAQGSLNLTADFVDFNNNRVEAHRIVPAEAGGFAVGFARLDLSDVRASIDATTANASAHVIASARDIGTVSRIYVFALAPQTLVKNATTGSLDDPAPCVLAQLDPATNQLIGISAANLNAFATGVLSAQAQAVTVLSNVPTPLVTGASFFVGYGPDPNTMISGWVNQSVVTIPGVQACPSRFPATPGPISGLWWNSNESGWGINFTQRRNIVFAAWYTYDSAGGAKWFVAPNCALSGGASPGGCTSTIYEVTNPSSLGAFNPAAGAPVVAGSLQLAFQSAEAAVMTYTVGAQTRTVPIARQVFATGNMAPAIDYTDLWWNPRQSGWGLAITHRSNVMFLAWYVYDLQGKPVWYVASNCNVNSAQSGCSGTLYRTTGPAFRPTFNSSQVQVFPAGTISLNFGDANNATINYTIDGVSGQKFITRQLF